MAGVRFDVFSCILPSIVKRETTDRHHENIQSLLPGIQNAYLLILGYISKENEEQGASLGRYQPGAGRARCGGHPVVETYRLIAE